MIKMIIINMTAQPQFIVCKNNPSLGLSPLVNLKLPFLAFKSAPQCLHLTASAKISSAQNGHFLVV